MVGLDETRTDLSRTTDDYVYDGQGKRLIKVSNERGPGGTPLVTTHTLYIGNLYEEEIPNGQNARAYTVYYMMGQKLVGLRRANWQGQSNGQYRIVGDMLGSTTLLVDTSTSPGPQVVQRQYYKPYGEVAFSWGSSRTSIGYTGQRLDGESGLMYYGARYYDPVLSFFTQADPTVPDASELEDYNKYLYVRGNPLRYIDTSGYGPDDYYVFVNGCVGGGCPKIGETDISGFDQYYELLRKLYTEGKWGYAFGDKYVGFDEWAKTHVIARSASSVDEGARQIAEVLASIPGNGDIHLFGTSQGGAAILQYIIDSGSGPPQYTGKKYQIDRRIASLTLIDATLDWQVKRKPSYSIGKFLAANTRVQTGEKAIKNNTHTALTVDPPLSGVEAGPIDDVAENNDPNYTWPSANWERPLGCINACRHEYSGRVPSPDTEAFLRRVWK